MAFLRKSSISLAAVPPSAGIDAGAEAAVSVDAPIEADPEDEDTVGGLEDDDVAAAVDGAAPSSLFASPPLPRLRTRG